MNGLCKSFVASLILFLMVFSLGASYRIYCVRGDEEALSTIENAENALKQAFVAVWEAEGAGANVSGLVARLNEAGELLAEAEIAYRVGDASEAVSKAEECSGLADIVRDEALTLKGKALAMGQNVFWQNLSITLVESVVFLIFLLFVWDWFKRVYDKKLLKMKPEVAVDAED